MALAPEAQPQGPARTGPALTAEQRRQVSALDVQGTLAIDRLVKGSLVATGLEAKAALDRGVLVLHDARAAFFGGRVDAAGTRVDLSQPNPGWNLKAKLDGVDLGQALQAMAGAAPLLGKVTGALDLEGSGVEWASARRAGRALLKEGRAHRRPGSRSWARWRRGSRRRDATGQRGGWARQGRPSCAISPPSSR
jgi:uncharacterized protein involved in outer membrane biogenesis